MIQVVKESCIGSSRDGRNKTADFWSLASKSISIILFNQKSVFTWMISVGGLTPNPDCKFRVSLHHVLKLIFKNFIGANVNQSDKSEQTSSTSAKLYRLRSQNRTKFSISGSILPSYPWKLSGQNWFCSRAPSYQVEECNHKRIHFEKDLLAQLQFLQELNSGIFELHPNYYLYQELLRTIPYLHQNFLGAFFTMSHHRWLSCAPCVQML